MDLKDKLNKLKGKRSTPSRVRPSASDTPPLFQRKVDGDHKIGDFILKEFKKLFPLYLPFFPSVLSSPEQMLFLDLETTSLSTGTGNMPFLVGTGFFEGEKFNVLQYLVPSPPLEMDVLVELLKLWKKKDVVITYNGKTFDIPLLKNRMVIYRLEGFEEKKHYDLYQLVKKMVKPANLHNVEREMLKLERPPGVEGGDIPRLYFEFLERGEIEILREVLERNLQDILSLPAILYRWVEKKNPLFFNDHQE